MKKIALIFSVCCILSCGNDAEKPYQNGNTEGTAPMGESQIVSALGENEIQIDLQAGDDMLYSTQEIRVHSGQNITLILKHAGKSHKNTMGHNFVLLQSGADPAQFARTASQFQERDFMPEDTSKIIVHTKLLSGGESDTLHFQAPAKGYYPFLCTFPGHVASMKGKFIVD